MINAQIKSYQNMAVTTASKEMLILLAYEGAIRFLSQARTHIEKGNIAVKCERISRTMAIIEELSASLNMEQGGEIAENLRSLYDYMMIKLPEANLNSDIRILEEVCSLLKTLHEGWSEAMAQSAAMTREVKKVAPALAPQQSQVAHSY